MTTTTSRITAATARACRLCRVQSELRQLDDEPAIAAASQAVTRLLGPKSDGRRRLACHIGIDALDQPVERVRPAVLTYLHDVEDADLADLAAELLREHYELRLQSIDPAWPAHRQQMVREWVSAQLARIA